MRGGREEVLLTLAESRRGLSTRELIVCLQNNAAAEQCYGFRNRAYAVLFGRAIKDLAEFPPARRIKATLAWLTWRGYLTHYRDGNAANNPPWCTRHKLTCAGEAYLDARRPRPTSARA